jgi:CSLREA domain-containing protein
MKHKTLFNLLLALGLLLAPSLGWLQASPARAAGFVVNSNADDSLAHDNMLGDGVCMDQSMRCTLRAAIEEANALAGADTITFSTAMNIVLDTGVGGLPTLTGQATIDASSVWDTTNNQPGVTLDGNNGMVSGLRLQADGCSIYGLYIKRFVAYGIQIRSKNNTIGGIALGQRNVISGNGAAGIVIEDSAAQYNVVQNNYIGTNPAGNAAAPNFTGVLITSGASNNIIGGSTTTVGNVISGNTYFGVRIEMTGTNGNGVGGNIIGAAQDGNTPLGNGSAGVRVDNGASGNYIGGGGALEGNIIVHNDDHGIYIIDSNSVSIERNTIGNNKPYGVFLVNSENCTISGNTITASQQHGVSVSGSAATGNWISQNSIYNNTNSGIMLVMGGNGGLAAPVVASATSGGASGTSCANCYIEVFSDGSDEGQTYHGAVNADGNGNWTYIGALSGPNVTATATDANLNTSEFSAPLTIGGANQPPNPPGCPSPINGDTQISIDPTLTWCADDPDGDSLTYTVMGGAQGSQWAQWCWNTTNPSCAPGALQPNTTYEWRVTATDGVNPAVNGPTWTFTTGSSAASSFKVYLPLTLK